VPRTAGEAAAGDWRGRGFHQAGEGEAQVPGAQGPGKRVGLCDNRDSQGAEPPPPLSLHVGAAGKNNLNEEINPILLTGIGERYCQTISNLGLPL
jgi:hypothetical protein